MAAYAVISPTVHCHEAYSDDREESLEEDISPPENTLSDCAASEKSNAQDASEADPPMSKRKRKRLEQKLRKQSYLKEIRLKERTRKKERLKEARAQGIDVGPSRKSLKHNTMAKSNCKIKVVVDCSFDDLMTEKDMKSIATQLNFCYAANRRASDPLQFHVTSYQGKLKSYMDSIGDHVHWDVHIKTENYTDLFSKESIVYLSSESKNVLQSLDDDKVYIIGGLVDHNHHKGVCLKLAEEKGLAHAQLPIGDFISLETRKILAVNHVFEILLEYTQTSAWMKAFNKVIPQRKGLQPKDPSGGAPSTHPSDGTSSTHPSGGTPSTHPSGGTSSTHPSDGTLSTHPSDGTSSTHPSDGTLTDESKEAPSKRQNRGNDKSCDSQHQDQTRGNTDESPELRDSDDVVVPSSEGEIKAAELTECDGRSIGGS